MFPNHQPRLSNFMDWQTAFIHNNFPVIGYYAWMGFNQVGWGLLVCHVEPPPTGAELNLHSWIFQAQFIPGQHLDIGLQALAIYPEETYNLVEAIAQYDPYREIMLLLHSDQSVEVNWLKNLAVSPLDCYWQVYDRWDEFIPNDLQLFCPELS